MRRLVDSNPPAVPTAGRVSQGLRYGKMGHGSRTCAATIATRWLDRHILTHRNTLVRQVEKAKPKVTRRGSIGQVGG